MSYPTFTKRVGQIQVEIEVWWGNISGSIFDPKWVGVRGGVTGKLAA